MADERVSILISGRLQVTCEGVLLHYIQPCEFVDSPEFESCPSGTLPKNKSLINLPGGRLDYAVFFASYFVPNKFASFLNITTSANLS